MARDILFILPQSPLMVDDNNRCLQLGILKKENDEETFWEKKMKSMAFVIWRV